MKVLTLPWMLLLASVVCADSFDYQLQPRRLAPDVQAFIGKTEDFNTVNGGNIVNTAFIEAADGLIVIDSGPSLRYGRQVRAAMGAVSTRPVALVINTHLHPDHMLGNLAYAGIAIGALPATSLAIASEGNAFAENLYRMSGDWMKGTEIRVPDRALSGGSLSVAGRRLQLIELAGHSGADLAVYDEKSGILFTGDLVFNGRAPTTPHADIPRWLAALDQLEALTRQPGFVALLPGHGEPAHDAAPIRQTRAWLQWLQQRMQEAARDGLDMNEVMARPLPPEFAAMPMAASEYRRSVAHLFPAAEAEVLAHGH